MGVVTTQTSLLGSLDPIEMTNVIELLHDRIHKLENQINFPKVRDKNFKQSIS